MNKENETQSAAAVVIDGVMHDMRDDFEYKITYPETVRHDICMKALPVAIKAIYGRGHVVEVIDPLWSVIYV